MELDESIDAPAYFITLTAEEIRRFWESQTLVITPDDVEQVTIDAGESRQRAEESLNALARQMMELVNRDRLAHAVESRHARPLQWDEQLANIAR